MQKNVFFLTLLFSCSAMIASEELDQQIIKKHHGILNIDDNQILSESSKKRKRTDESVDTEDLMVKRQDNHVRFKDVNNFACLQKYIEDRNINGQNTDKIKENKELATLGFFITYPQISIIIFEYLIPTKTQVSQSTHRYHLDGEVYDKKQTKTEYFFDEEKSIAKITDAIKDNMDWQTVGNILQTIELYQSLQAKNLSTQYVIKINPDWLKNYTGEGNKNLLHIICEQNISTVADILLYEKQQSLIMRELCHNNVDVNAQDNYGDTPLLYAASKNNPSAITMLCNQGADVNAQDTNGYTPLHIAACHNNGDTIRTLCIRYADVTIKNKYGQLAEELTKKPEIKSLFAQLKIDRKK